MPVSVYKFIEIVGRTDFWNNLKLFLQQHRSRLQHGYENLRQTAYMVRAAMVANLVYLISWMKVRLSIDHMLASPSSCIRWLVPEYQCLCSACYPLHDLVCSVLSSVRNLILCFVS